MLMVAAMLSVAGATPAMGEPVSQGSDARAMPTEFSSQGPYAARSRYEERPRIRVRPGGRLLYRDCKFWLAQEYRPSGTVIVPRQYCWWVRG